MTLLGPSTDPLRTAVGPQQARPAFLLELADRTRPMQDMSAFQEELSRLLTEHLGASHAGFASHMDDGPGMAIGAHYQAGGLPKPRLQHYELPDDNCLSLLRSGRRVMRHLPGLEALDIPLMREGRLAAIFFVHFHAPHEFTTEELKLAEDTATRAWDTAERLRLEAELHHCQQRHRVLFDGVHVAVAMASPSGAILSGNAAFGDLLGLDLAALHERNMVHLLHPDDQPVISAALDGLSTQPGERCEADLRYVNQDGSVVAVHQQMTWLSSGHGKTPQILLIVHPAVPIWANPARSEGAASQQSALAMSEAHFRSLAENMPALTWMANPDGRVFWYNRRWYEYTGTRAEDMHGWGWETVQHPDHLPDVRKRWQDSLQTGEPFEMTFPLRSAEGVFRPFLTRVVPLKDDDGHVTRWFGTNTDVSPERDIQARLALSEAALQESDRRKDDILATLSHELRNPLAPILTASMLLASAKLTPERATEATHIIQRQVKHMARLLDDLLQMARLTQGKLELQLARTRLHDIVETAVETARPLLDRKGHALTLVLPNQEVWLLADSLRVSQILSNLLNNAAKYTPSEGTVRLSACVQGHSLRLQVDDNGIGLPPGASDRLFTMFAKLPGESQHAEGGLGIGLALTKGLVDLHQGHIEAFSEGLGCGTRITVTLPLPPTPELDLADTVGQSRHRRLRVMVVDDNQDAADTLLLLIEQDGHDVRAVHGGLLALSLAAEFQPDIALIDIGMPGMDGHAVAKALRGLPCNAPLRLIALTGWSQEEDRRKAAEAGFDTHLTKPVDGAQLLGLLSSISAI